MSDKHVPWAEGRRALVLTSRGWRECVGMASGRYRGWVWTCPSTNFMGEPSTMEVFETTRDGEDLPTRPLPDHCGTCFEPFGCGCPGDGWGVPVHVRLPEVVDGAELRGHERLYRVFKSGWVCNWIGKDILSRPGDGCRPLVPFKDRRPIYLKMWGQS